ncbi:hypothetical protein Gotur_017592 [Gossypium turneri]
MSSSCGVTKDSTIRSEARSPARAYATRVREDASALDVITGTFALYDIDVAALIDPELTHLGVIELTTIEEAKDLESLRIHELIGSLQTFEKNPDEAKPSKGNGDRNIALQVTEVVPHFQNVTIEGL